MKFFVKLLFIVFFFFLVKIKSDIPTHCFKSQVEGKWIFSGTKTQKYTIKNLYDLKCGIKDHTSDISISKSIIPDNQFTEKFSIILNDDFTANFEGNDGKKLLGKWTMVYDEGFEIILGDKTTQDYISFFVFIKYSQNQHKNSKITSKWVSHCYESLIGWYHRGDYDWGCFKGHKDVQNFSQVTNGEASNKQNITQDSIISSFVEQISDIKQEIRNFFASNRFMQNQWKNSNKLLSKSSNKLLTEIKLTLQSRNHAEVVERINSMNLSWKAAEYEQFKDYSIGQLNEFLNNKKNQGRFNFSLTRTEKYKNENTNDRFSATNKKEMEFSKYLGKPKSQGSCGSCYAVSTISMLEARFNYKYGKTLAKYFSKDKPLEFSDQHVIRCSYYNQGCEGGYSYLVSKFYKEYELIPKQCMDLKLNQCHQTCKEGNLKNLKFKVTDYYYVGGHFGGSDDSNILEELMKNGPFVVSLTPDYGFLSYSSGIYDSNTQNWKTLGIIKPEWQKVDHSVLLIGWGVENGIEYWKIMNSWGSHWGEKGTMRIKKGKNLINIESLGEAAIVELIENSALN